MSNSVVAGVEMLFDMLADTLRNDLEPLAAFMEMDTRAESDGHWQDDSGSARDSITAYSMGAGDHAKNFDASNWSQAKTAGYVSPVWGNTDANFQEYVEDVDTDSDIGVVLTMFVPYAEALENGNQGRAFTGHRMDGGNEPRPSVVPGLIEKMSDVLKDNFESAVTQIIQSVL